MIDFRCAQQELAELWATCRIDANHPQYEDANGPSVGSRMPLNATRVGGRSNSSISFANTLEGFRRQSVTSRMQTDCESGAPLVLQQRMCRRSLVLAGSASGLGEFRYERS